jgi:DNA-binding transcriptional MerR regulator
MDFKLPDKLTFKRKEVINITRLDGKVIDYWQNEFGCFNPVVNNIGEIFYTRRDLELLLKIKAWLIEEKLEKSKVKEMLEKGFDYSSQSPVSPISKKKKSEKLDSIKSQLKEILTILDKNDKK